ncbi:MAG: hypothetical protein AAB289_07465, partial [Chloroflexota bacterium]
MTTIKDPPDDQMMPDPVGAGNEQRPALAPGVTATSSSGRTVRTYEMHDLIARRRFRIYRINQAVYLVFGILE